MCQPITVTAVYMVQSLKVCLKILSFLKSSTMFWNDCWKVSISTSCSFIQSKILSEPFQLPDKQPACWHALFGLNKLTKIWTTTQAVISHHQFESSLNKTLDHTQTPLPLYFFFFFFLVYTSLYPKQFFSSCSNFVVSGVWQKHGLTSTQDCRMHNRLCYSSELFMPICVL